MLSSIGGRTGAVLDALAATPGFFESAEGRVWLSDLAMLVGTENQPDDVRAFLDRFAGGQASIRAWPAWRSSAWAADFGRSGGSLRAVLKARSAARASPRSSPRPPSRGGRRIPAARVDAIGLLSLGLGRCRLARSCPPCSMLGSRGRSSSRHIQALASHADPRVGPAIVAHWKAMGPAVRREAAEAALRPPERVGALLDGLESGRSRPGRPRPGPPAQLLATRDKALHARAEKLLANGARPTAAPVIAAFRTALDPRRRRPSAGRRSYQSLRHLPQGRRSGGPGRSRPRHGHGPDS